MRFTKMHGAGNDYIYIDGFAERVADPGDLARIMTDRHCGVGGDGLILIVPSAEADVRMRMFNVDGSEAEMCGNGLRCLAKYAYEHGLARVNPMRVQTAAGIKTIELALGGDGTVTGATVDMGEPILEPRRIPVAVEGPRAVDVPISAGGERFRMTCVSMGNPHAVIYVEDVAAVDLGRLGPELEHHAIFPRRANVHFVQVRSAGTVVVRTWERGSGATLACGTGACAVGVAGVLTGRGGREVAVHMPGGELGVAWRESDNHVYLTGPAVEVFSGDWPG
jgi:diaminopimelate epimerase